MPRGVHTSPSPSCVIRSSSCNSTQKIHRHRKHNMHHYSSSRVLECTMTMKTVVASVLLLATAAQGFSPSASSPATTALNHSINTRHRIEDQELGIWPQSSSDRSAYVPGHAVSGHEVRSAWTSYAPKHGSPDTIGTIGSVSRESSTLTRANGAVGAVSGEDIRESRTSYAPYNIHEGRVGSLGVIGYEGSSSGHGSNSRID